MPPPDGSNPPATHPDGDELQPATARDNPARALAKTSGILNQAIAIDDTAQAAALSEICISRLRAWLP